MDFGEHTFNGLRMTLEDVNRGLEEEEEEAGQIGNIGTLFSPRNRGPSATRRTGPQRRGNHPSRIFVFLGSRNVNAVVTSDCPSHKIKFPSSSTYEEMMVLLRRVFTDMGTSPRQVFCLYNFKTCVSSRYAHVIIHLCINGVCELMQITFFQGSLLAG